MKITWQAEDGYAGGARPHTTKVDDADIKDCGTVDEAMKLIEESIAEDFTNSVQPGWDYEKVREQVKELLK